MKRFVLFVTTTLLGYVGWWLAEDAGIFPALLVSTLGSVAGVFLGLKLYNDVLS
jgi:hypothetical protein